MKNQVFAIVLLLSNFCFAADDMATPSHGSYTELKQTLKDFNKKRISNSKSFEEEKVSETTVGLPQTYLDDLKASHWSGEFSDRKSAEILLKESINPRLCVLSDTDVETLTGGFVSGDIYKVKATDPQGITQDFFIKYLRTKLILVSRGRCVGEQANLGFLLENKKIADINTYLKITLPEIMCQYPYKDEKKVCMVLPAAAGQSFSEIVNSGDLNLINAAFKALGTALGRMHTTHRYFKSDSQSPDTSPHTAVDFLNTLVLSHGDLHGQNVFYDPETGRISFIDVETMANSFDVDGNPSSPICYDMLYMLLMSPGKFGKYMPRNNWQPFKKLLKAYTESYTVEERNGIYDYLINCFNQADSIAFIDIFKHFKWKKVISDQETIDGAQTLADYVKELKLTLKRKNTQFVPLVYKGRSLSLSQRPSIMPITTTPEECRKTIEGYYESLNRSESASSSSSESSVESSQPSSPSVSVLRARLAKSGVLDKMYEKRSE